MNCPFTHTSCDKGCPLYLIGDVCLFREAILAFLLKKQITEESLLNAVKILDRGLDAKRTRKKAKVTSKEKRTRVKAN